MKMKSKKKQSSKFLKTNLKKKIKLNNKFLSSHKEILTHNLFKLITSKIICKNLQLVKLTLNKWKFNKKTMIFSLKVKQKTTINRTKLFNNKKQLKNLLQFKRI